MILRTTHSITKKKTADQSGFTLLESMIGMVVMGIGLIGLAQLLLVSMAQSNFGEYNTLASELARGKIEELKMLYSAELESGVTASDLTDGTHGPETATLVSPEYTRQGDQVFDLGWTVQSAGKELIVTVNVQSDSFLRSKTVSLTSRFAP